MNKIVALFWKDKRSKISLIAGACSILAVIFYVIMWLTTSYEATETPGLAIAMGLVTAVLCVLSSFKNWFHVVGLAGFVCSVVTLFVIVAGRVSYLAFYFSGDAMATGLSPMLVAALIFAFAAVVINAVAIFADKE